jgi:hypothetical protein
MHAVINRLPIKPDADWDALAAKVDAFHAGIAHPEFRGLCLIRADAGDAFIVVLFTSRAALDALSRDVAAPWFAEHIRPYLAGAVSRSVGEIIAGALTPTGIDAPR